jgi:EAL domain-containing protein (putative c-di-GMP-specific phosphodiesterase class I)
VAVQRDPVSSLDQPLDELLQDALRAVRKNLGMEVAFISEFQNGRRFFRYVDAEASFCPICVGGSDPLDQSYCQRIVEGLIPELLPNAREHAEALKLDATTLLPVGAHLSVPVVSADGEVIGTVCCFSREPNLLLDQRDLNVVRLYAEFVGKALSRLRRERQAREEVQARISSAIQRDAFYIVYQPIVHVDQRKLAGHEALTRFTAGPVRSPQRWFTEATAVGLHEELELAVIQRALDDLPRFPKDTYLSLNVSPETILSGSLPRILEGHPLERLVLEVTEHASIDDYAPIASELEPLRRQGLRLAVDDAGAGFASFRHIILLKPDIIKLDVSLVRAIDSDKSIRALAAALIRFAEETGSKVVAEGVETKAELAALCELKVTKVQGYLLGAPSRFEELKLFKPASQYH